MLKPFLKNISIKTICYLILSIGFFNANSQIIIQGDIREKIMGELVHQGYKVKRVGG